MSGPRSVTVRVPGTSANLACGFDVIGCAWNLYNTLRYTLSDALTFTGCDAAYRNADNPAWQSFAALYRRLDRTPPPVSIDIRAEVPVCRGLGSSAALLAAGVMAANVLSGAKLSKAEIARRRKALKPWTPRIKGGWLERYARFVGNASTGASLKGGAAR